MAVLFGTEVFFFELCPAVVCRPPVSFVAVALPPAAADDALSFDEALLPVSRCFERVVCVLCASVVCADVIAAAVVFWSVGAAHAVSTRKSSVNMPAENFFHIKNALAVGKGKG